jgi:putative endonuclease
MRLLSFLRRFSHKPPPLPDAPGPRAEELAARFLAGKGLRILGRNHRCRSGEVDLICRDGDTVVFVEVRLRSDAEHGGAGASITPAKRRRIIQAARHWLSGKPECPCRFDCILLTRPEPDAIEWIKGAFDTK